MSLCVKVRKVYSCVSDGTNLGVPIDYPKEESPIGTADAPFPLRDRLTEDFLLREMAEIMCRPRSGPPASMSGGPIVGIKDSPDGSPQSGPSATENLKLNASCGSATGGLTNGMRRQA